MFADLFLFRLFRRRTQTEFIARIIKGLIDHDLTSVVVKDSAMAEYNEYLNKRLQSTALALPECGPRSWYKGESRVRQQFDDAAIDRVVLTMRRPQIPKRASSSPPRLGQPVSRDDVQRPTTNVGR